MGNDESPRIEPTLAPVVDAPSVAPAAEAPAAETARSAESAVATSAEAQSDSKADRRPEDILAAVARANAKASGVLNPESIIAEAAATRARIAAEQKPAAAQKPAPTPPASADPEGATETAKGGADAAKPISNLPPATRLYIEPKAEKEEPRTDRRPNSRPDAHARTDSKREPHALIFRMPDGSSARIGGRPEEVVVKPRMARFALLAASIAIAACCGAIAGSLGVAYYAKTPGLFARALEKAPEKALDPAPVAPKVVARDTTSDEVKALKDTVTQLRATTKVLSDNLAALKNTVTSSNTAQNTQISKIAETLDRVEKSQAEQRKTAAAQPAPAQPAPVQAAAAQPAAQVAQAPSQETTGSLPRPPAHALPPVEPNPALKQSIVQGYILRRVYDGAALIEGREGIIEVEVGAIAPGLGRIENIKRQDGRWVVVTARGLVVGR